MISAREAELKADFSEGLLHLELVDGYVELGGEVTLRFPETIRQAVSVTNPGEWFTSSSHPSHMRTMKSPGPKRISVRSWRRSGNLRQHLHHGTRNPGGSDGPDAPEPQEPEDAGSVQQQRLHRLETEPHRRWASGFSCLSFVLVGVPLAVRLRNADYFTTFGICFLPILILYYPLFMIGLDGAKNGRLPPYSVWLGNLVCVVVGSLLYRGVVRH
jgi:lipopolysaccharide export system permease protein